jgi:flagellar hook-associated protein 1 FlgK
MPGLFGNLSLASKALMAHQAAIQVTSRNIANVNNPEHARQRVVMGDKAFVPTSQGPEGTGVEVLTVEQIRDAFLDRQVVRQIADEASLQAQSDALTNVELALGDRIDRSTDPASVQDSTKSSSGIGAALDEFFNAFDSLASSPSDMPAREVAVQKAQILADRINNAIARLDAVQMDLGVQIEADLKKANVLLSDIARLNAEIADANIRESGSAADLVDRRQGKLEALSGILRIETAVIPNAYGQIEVSIGGVKFVDYGQKFGELSYDSERKVIVSDQNRDRAISNGVDEVVGALTIGSSDISVDSTDGLFVGMSISGEGIPPGAVVARVTENTITLSTQASSTKIGVNLKYSWPSGGAAEGRLTAMKGNIADARTRLHNIAGSLASGVNGKYDVDQPFFETSKVKVIESRTDSATVTLDGIPENLKVGSTLLGQRVKAISGNTVTLGGNANAAVTSSDVSYFSEGAIQSISVNAAISAGSLKTSSQSFAGGNDYLMGIAALRSDKNVLGMGGITLGDYARNTVGQIGQVLQGINTRLEESSVIKTAITTQRDGVSSVSLDEETADLMRFQRAYQANARVISIVDELLDTLINRMVR